MVGSETSTRNWSAAPIRSFARTPVAWDKVAGDHYQVSILKWIPRALTTHLLPGWGGCPVKNTKQRQYPNQNLPFFFRADAQSVAKIETPLCRGHRGHRGRRCTVCACCWNNSSTLWFHTISGSQTSRSDAQRPSTQVQAEPRSSNVVYLSACMRLPLTRCTNNILSVCGIKVFFFISGTFFFPFN